MPEHPDPARRTAVVLGSSFLGVYAHTGFLNGLHSAGLRPARVTGASAGALAGALFCSGLRGDDLRLAALDPRLRRSFADLGALWRLPGVATSFWSTGLFTGKRFISRLERLLGDCDLSSLSPPLDVAVTDIATSLPEIRRRGPLAPLVMASCAVPVLFAIQTIGNHRYLDGGIACELPFEHLLDDPNLDCVLLHKIRHPDNSGPNVPWETIANSVGASHHATCNELHRLRTDLAHSTDKHLIEIETPTPFPGIFGRKRPNECYQLGFESGLAAAARI